MSQYQHWCAVATFDDPRQHYTEFRIPFSVDPRQTHQVANAIGEQIARGIGATPLYTERFHP